MPRRQDADYPATPLTPASSQCARRGFPDGQGDDDFVAALEEGFNLRQRIRRIIERHEEAFLAILTHHHGFKGVYVRAAGLVFLFYLDGIPAFFQAQFAFLLLARSTSNQQPAMTAESVVSRALFIERIVDRNWGI